MESFKEAQRPNVCLNAASYRNSSNIYSLDSLDEQIRVIILSLEKRHELTLKSCHHPLRPIKQKLPSYKRI